MEPPANPIDLKIILGDEEGQQNLVNAEFGLELGPNAVAQFKEVKKLTLDLENDLVLVFDFHVEQGREKQAIEYFNKGLDNPDDQTLSPLQKVFHRKPSDESEVGTFEMEEHIGFVRLLYRFYHQGDFAEMSEHIEQFLASGFNPSANINIDLKGYVSHNKKNRTNVKVNYAKTHVFSNVFSSDKMLDALSAVGVFDGEAEIVNNPAFDLLRRSKKVKATIKLASFRKILKYFEEVAYEAENPKKHETKGFNYVNTGLLRKKAECGFSFKGKYTGNFTVNYESEDVFLRLLKVYLTLLQKQFDIDLMGNSMW